MNLKKVTLVTVFLFCCLLEINFKSFSLIEMSNQVVSHYSTASSGNPDNESEAVIVLEIKTSNDQQRLNGPETSAGSSNCGVKRRLTARMSTGGRFTKKMKK